MADQLHLAPSRVFDANAAPVAGALAYFYLPGTTTPITVFADEALTVAHPNPLPADAAGAWPQVYCAGHVKVNVTTPGGATLPGYPLDPAILSPGSGSGASSISFSPVASIPVTDVQAAIERVQANIPTLIAAAGVATLTAPLLADFNSLTATGGIWRFDGTTAGTRPTGWAGVTGAVLILSIGAGLRVQLAFNTAANELSWRRYDGTWRPWGDIAHGNKTQNNAAWDAGTATLETVVSPAKAHRVVTSRRFESAEFALAEEVIVAHGLGVMPWEYRASLRCKTAEYGWLVNDEVTIDRDDAPGSSMITIGANATQIWCLMLEPATIRINERSSSATIRTITPANWRVVLRAMR